ncbi:MAG: hypothetical protein AB7U98_14405 [Candidatus Nitrosocosmicus sp.]|jgi:predicted mannosyl-3-phosphoglycerate phosphatase (HAD superfamily)
MLNDNELTEEQLDLIGKKLSLAIGNKEHSHPLRDYPKAALIFHSINNEGYYFYSDTIDKVFEISTEKYSDKIKNDLKNLAESITYLNIGLNDPVLWDYKVTAKELAL